MRRIGKSAEERRQIAEMAEAVARYDGPIRHCPPGVARGHEYLALIHRHDPAIWDERECCT
jgi:hypothetical protein